MELKVVRYGQGSESTGGLLFVDNCHFGYLCEDQYQPKKVAGETRIPRGRYQIKLRDAGGMNVRYKKQFPDFHRGMLHLQDVPDFEWIYIHIGNTDDHTAGCLLVGYTASRLSAEYTVGRSTDAYKTLYKMIVAAMDRGEQVYISIADFKCSPNGV